MEGRDPARVDAVLAVLRAVWERHPDLRLVQLIFLAVPITEPCPDLFYVEDERLLRALQELKDV